MLLSCNTLANFRLALLKPVAPRVRLSPLKLSFTIHKDISEIQGSDWQKTVAESSVFLQPRYLAAMCTLNAENLEFRFACFFRNNELVGIAAFQITHFESSDISTNVDTGNKIVSALAHAFRPSGKNRKLNVLICGNAFSTGEHAFWFAPSVKPVDAMNGLCRVISSIVKEERTCDKRISGILVKDFYSSSFDYATELRKCGFRDFNVDQNMVMPLMPEWNSFDDYLDSLNSKFRTKAKAAINKSASLEIDNWNSQDIRNNLDVIQTLYNAVYDRADFRLGKLEAQHFVCLKEAFGDDFIFRAYSQDGKVVGFLTSFLRKGIMDAHLIGIDYNKNKEYGIYARMLYDYIELAILSNCSQLIFGRTAGEIKSAAGAIAVDLKCCIRHPGRISNVLLTLLFSYVKPSEYALRQPWRMETLKKFAGIYIGTPLGNAIKEIKS